MTTATPSPPIRVRTSAMLPGDTVEETVEGVLRSRAGTAGATVNGRPVVAQLSDGAAATLASWWAAPSGVGFHLGVLSRGGAVGKAELIADVDATLREYGMPARPAWPASGTDPDEMDARALYLLRDWAESKP